MMKVIVLVAEVKYIYMPLFSVVYSWTDLLQDVSLFKNSNNESTDNNCYCGTAIARVHPVHLMNAASISHMCCKAVVNSKSFSLSSFSNLLI